MVLEIPKRCAIWRCKYPASRQATTCSVRSMIASKRSVEPGRPAKLVESGKAEYLCELAERFSKALTYEFSRAS